MQTLYACVPNSQTLSILLQAARLAIKLPSHSGLHHYVDGNYMGLNPATFARDIFDTVVNGVVSGAIAGPLFAPFYQHGCISYNHVSVSLGSHSVAAGPPFPKPQHRHQAYLTVPSLR